MSTGESITQQSLSALIMRLLGLKSACGCLSWRQLWSHITAVESHQTLRSAKQNFPMHVAGLAACMLLILLETCLASGGQGAAMACMFNSVLLVIDRSIL
jgi:hypothetical protein